MKTAVTAAAALLLALPAAAQSPRQASFMDSVWGYHLLETGGGVATLFTGQPSLYEGHPNAVITIVSRDRQALTEADRSAAIQLARALCERTGRHFNTQTRGHWLPSGGLGFQGACTQW